MDPISIASQAIGALGSILGGVFGFLGAKNQQKAEWNAGQQAVGEAGVASDIALQQGNSAEAASAAESAAMGGGVTGSALDAIKGIAARAGFNAHSAIYRGQTEEQAHVYKGQLDMARGYGELISGVAGAGGTALSSFAKAADARMLASGNPSGGGASGSLVDPTGWGAASSALGGSGD